MPSLIEILEIPIEMFFFTFLEIMPFLSEIFFALSEIMPSLSEFFSFLEEFHTSSPENQGVVRNN